MKAICNFIFWVIFLSGCKSPESDNNNHKLSSNKRSDTITRNICPFHLRKDIQAYWKKKNELLGLDSIENNACDWQIRLWISHSYRDSTQLIVFKKKEKKFTATLYTFKGLGELSAWDTATYLFSRTGQITPKTSWKPFIRHIEELGIFDLPDYTELKDYHVAADGWPVTVEFYSRERNMYRIYEYPDYEGLRDIPEADRMYQIMESIEVVFGIKVIY